MESNPSISSSFNLLTIQCICLKNSTSHVFIQFYQVFLFFFVCLEKTPSSWTDKVCWQCHHPTSSKPYSAGAFDHAVLVFLPSELSLVQSKWVKLSRAQPMLVLLCHFNYSFVANLKQHQPKLYQIWRHTYFWHIIICLLFLLKMVQTRSDNLRKNI